jgi:hypothetical protein
MGKSRDESATGWDESAARASVSPGPGPLSQIKTGTISLMSIAIATEPTTSQTQSPRSTTKPTTNPATQTSPNAAQRLRTTMAVVKLSFTWLGVRRTLARDFEQIQFL